MATAISEEEYRDHEDSSDGFCTECLDWTRHGMTEPDAEGYECPRCERRTCIGAMNAMMEGYVEIE